MKKIIILISLLLSILFISGCSNSDTILNTDEDILEYINESGLMNNIGVENLSIIDTIHIDNSKIVTFLSNTGQGYIVCEKNEKGNYIMTDNMAEDVSNELGVSDFTVRYNHNSGFENRDMAYIVISDGSKVSNVEMTINDHVFSKKLKIGKPSMAFVNLRDDFSNDELKSISLYCKYFDIDNNELETNKE